MTNYSIAGCIEVGTELRQEAPDVEGCSRPARPSGLQRKKGRAGKDLRTFAESYSGNLELRNQLILEHLPQVRFLARRIHDHLPQHVPIEDLVQAGVLGLIDALHHFDPGRNVQLKSYARARIQGAILDSLRELDWATRTLRRRARQLDNAHHNLGTRLGRAPTEAEVAAEVGIGLHKFQHLLADLHGLEVVSLQSSGKGDREGNPGSDDVAWTSGEDPARLCLHSEMSTLLRRAMAGLPARKRQVLELYYWEGLTMKEIGGKLGVVESRVSQIHSAALVRLRPRLRQSLESCSSHPNAREQELPGSDRVSPAPASYPVAYYPCVKLVAAGPCGWGESPANFHLQFPWKELNPPQAIRVHHYGPMRPRTRHSGSHGNRVLSG